jgi:hypothetical protein
MGPPSLFTCPHSVPGFVWLLSGGVPSAATVEESLELRLRHLRATVDPTILRFLVELSVGPAAGSGVGTQPTTPTRGQVVHRRPTRGPRFAGSRAFLVDGPRGDLLRLVFRPALLPQPFLDVFVLTLTLLAPGLLRHVDLPSLFSFDLRPFDRTRQVRGAHVERDAFGRDGSRVSRPPERRHPVRR